LDVGIPGLIVYLAMMMLTAVSALQTARRSPYWRPWALALLSALIAIHLFGLTDALALGSKPGLVQWLIIGLILALPRLADQTCTPPPD
jgi:putative inorganic carbon (HCO3(-)) transporter